MGEADLTLSLGETVLTWEMSRGLVGSLMSLLTLGCSLCRAGEGEEILDNFTRASRLSPDDFFTAEGEARWSLAASLVLARSLLSISSLLLSSARSLFSCILATISAAELGGSWPIP